jgi:hypothetical protein
MFFKHDTGVGNAGYGAAQLNPFNIMDDGRFGYNTLETSANFGRPNASGGPARTGQLGFRLSF